MLITMMVKKKRRKNKGKVATCALGITFEIARSGQRSRTFELATTTVRLIVRGGYLHLQVITI